MVKISSIHLLMIFLFVSCATGNSPKSDKETKADIYYSYGTSYLIDQNYTEALKYLLKANQLAPDSAKILSNLAMAYYFKDRFDLAISHLEKAIEEDPKYTDAYVNLGGIYLKEHQYQKALKNFDQAQKDLTYPLQYKTLYNLGLTYQKMGDIRKADHYYNLALKENSDYCPALFKKAEILELSRSYQEALNAYKDATKGICYNNPAPIYKQALMLIKLNKLIDAKFKLEEIVNKFPQNQYATLGMEQIHKINRVLKVRNSSNSADNTQVESIKNVSSPKF